MSASLENPIYTAYIISGSTKYKVSSVTQSIDISDQEKQIAKCVTLNLANITVGGKRLRSLIKPRDRIYLYANDGTKNDEVFRGFLWQILGSDNLETREIRVRCYDHLIYFQKSDEYEYFSSGKSTKAVCSSLFDKWGVKLEYTYDSITHSKLALRGKLSDIITSDVLDLVKDRTGKKYVILSEKDIVKIRKEGTNQTIYTIKAKNNAVSVSEEETMEGIITKVVILGKADDEDEREPVEATVKGNTSQYGTIQSIINRDENTSLADAKKEAQSIIDKNGKPKRIYEIKAPDIPWIRKGDKFKLEAGVISKYLIAKSIERDISNKGKTMTIDAGDV